MINVHIGLNQLAIFHTKSVLAGGMGFGPAASVAVAVNQAGAATDSLFSFCLQKLFEMIIFPSSSDYGIASDRIDACACTFSTLIAMDVPRLDCLLISIS